MAALAGVGCSADASVVLWQGGIGNWNDINWSVPASGAIDQPPPGDADYAIINQSGSVVTIDSSVVSNGFTLGAPGSPELIITTGGAYNASATPGNYFLIGDGGSFQGLGPGLVTINDGSLDYTGDFFIFGRDQNGTLNQSGGVVTVNAPQLWVGQIGGTTGILNLSGGTFSSNFSTSNVDENPVVFGRDPGSSGQLNISGTANVTFASNALISGLGQGSMTMTGGSFAAPDVYVGTNNNAPVGTSSGAFDMSGGTMQISRNLAVGLGGSGTGIISGTANVSVAGGVYVGLGNSTANLTVTGGSLTATTVDAISHVGFLDGANGTLSLTDGTTTFWHLVQGDNFGQATTATGTVNVSGAASLTIFGDWRVGWGGTGVLNLDSSSAATVNRNFVVEGANSQLNLTLSDNSDPLLVLGSTFLFSSPLLRVTLNMSGVSIGDEFVLVNGSASMVTGTFGNVVAGTPFALNNLMDPTGSYEGTVNYNGGADGNDIVLTLTTIPEPSTASFAIVAAACLIPRFRARARKLSCV